MRRYLTGLELLLELALPVGELAHQPLLPLASHAAARLAVLAARRLVLRLSAGDGVRW